MTTGWSPYREADVRLGSKADFATDRGGRRIMLFVQRSKIQAASSNRRLPVVDCSIPTRRVNDTVAGRASHRNLYVFCPLRTKRCCRPLVAPHLKRQRNCSLRGRRRSIRAAGGQRRRRQPLAMSSAQRTRHVDELRGRHHIRTPRITLVARASRPNTTRLRKPC